MIIFKKLRIKNFLSFGNNPIEVQLDKTSKTLLIGGNGKGKSAIHTALSFCLFGKTQRKVNIPQLVNSINCKDCLVELDFTIGSDQFLLKRGIKPQVFEIYKNDVLINLASQVKDYQKFLEENILKTNFKTFSNVIIIGGKNYSSFMNQPKADRRKMIESLLDIDIFSSMNQIAKIKSLELQEQFKEKKGQLNYTSSEINFLKSSKEKTLNILNNAQQETNNKIQEFKEKINEINYKISNLDNQLNKIYKDHGNDLESIQKDFLKKKEKLDINKQLCKNKLISIHKEQNFFETNESCPVCKQEISSDVKTIFLQSKQKELEDLSNTQSNLEENQSKLIELLSEVNDTLQQINHILKEKNNLLQLQQNYESIIKDFQVKSYDTNNLSSEISLLETSISSKEDELLLLKIESEKIREENDYVDFCQILLKDDGIKTLIIREYLPQINNHLNSFLEKLDLFIDFQFDENFNEIIRSRHRDLFTYESFSDGQKMKIDLALLFTFREIAKCKNSLNTNILFFDEIFDQSLDPISTELAIKLLNFLSFEISSFVISHKAELFETKMDRVLTLSLNNNFSQISES